MEQLAPPKPKQKPIERSDYTFTVELIAPICVPPYTRSNALVIIDRESMTRAEATAFVEKTAQGFSKVINAGTLTLITKYNIAAVHATKKEKIAEVKTTEGDPVPQQETAGALQPPA